jgi:hypothetical protein
MLDELKSEGQTDYLACVHRFAGEGRRAGVATRNGRKGAS